MELVKLENITKSYQDSRGELVVLKSLDLALKPAESAVITGESGSGKSTLLHILGTLDSPDSGRYFFNGSQIFSKDPKNNLFRLEKIGFVFQFHYLLEDLTALENVAMPIFLKEKNFTKAKKWARDILRIVNLIDRQNSYPNKLSGGELQRVAVARALANRPQLVLADEPTGNLDPRNSEGIVNLFLKLNKKYAQSFIIATHDLTISKLFSKHFLLEDGTLKRKQ